MPSFSAAPSSFGGPPLPASTPSNWTYSKPKTFITHSAIIVFPFKPLPFSPFSLLILLCPLNCVKSTRVVFYLFIYSFICSFIYYISFSQNPSRHKAKCSSNGVLTVLHGFLLPTPYLFQKTGLMGEPESSIAR